jgi:hypothetical protein
MRPAARSNRIEGLDLQRHRRLRDEQLLGGFAKIEVFGDSAKDFEAKILKLRHGWLTE